MKKIICMILVVLSILSCTLCLASCGEDDCPICGGSGYFQKKDCPGC